MKTIEVDDCVYERLEKIADRLQLDVATILYNPITDNVLEDYYEEDLRARDEVERDRSDERKELLLTRETVAGSLIW